MFSSSKQDSSMKSDERDDSNNKQQHQQQHHQQQHQQQQYRQQQQPQQQLIWYGRRFRFRLSINPSVKDPTERKDLLSLIAGIRTGDGVLDKEKLTTCHSSALNGSNEKFPPLGGPRSTMDSILALHPAAPGWFPRVPKNFSEFLMLPRLIDSAAA